MLRENEGTPPSVTVRLYDITQRPPKAKYLQIAKSVISGNRHSAGALWVPMIEKAYAALGIASDKDNRQPTIGSKSYAQLGSGGTSDVAFGVLTGNTGFNRSGIDRGSSDLFAIPPWSESDTLNYSFLETRDADQDEMDFLRGMVSYKFFFNESKDQDTAKALTATWMKYVRQNGVQSALDAANHIGQIEMILKHPDQVEAINGASPLDDEIANALLTELEKGIPGKRGTARYTERQRQIFGAIKDALAAGRYVAVSTPATIASKQTATGQSAGEPVAKGLAGNHAYSVLAVKDDVATGRKWVRIRNPWGGDPVGYGRVYKEKGDGVLSVQQDPKVLEKKQSATFDLELSNLTKRFDNWYVSG